MRAWGETLRDRCDADVTGVGPRSGGHPSHLTHGAGGGACHRGRRVRRCRRPGRAGLGRRTGRRRGVTLGARRTARPRVRGSIAAGAPCCRRRRAEPARAGSATSGPTSPSATGWSRRTRADRARAAAAFGVRAPGVVRGCPGRVPTRSPPTSTSSSSPTRSASTPNQRRLERELVLAFDSGAEPAIVLTKADLVDDPEPAAARGHRGGARRAGARRQRAHRRWASRSCGRSPTAAPDAGLPRGQRRRQVDADQRHARRRACRRRTAVRTATSAAATPPSPPSCCRCRAAAG